MIEKQIISSQCRDLLKSNIVALTYVIEEIKREQEGPINLDTVEKIALEYTKRQGVKAGLTLLLQRLNTKADLRD